MVRRVISQSSRITAVEDNGCLVMDKALIEKIVLQELGKIFKRKTSQIFLSKGEQLLIANRARVNHTTDDWMVKKDGGNKFQDEICRPVSSAELASIVKTHM